jgi:alpha-tubulin suppressor-like RCC1 family protein
MDQVNFVDCQISKYSQKSTALAVDMQGKVYAWGHNNMGQLGHGDTRNRKLPTQI